MFGSIAFQITSAPRRKRLSIVRETLSSLPGTGLDARTTVSPSRMRTSRWSPTAMRESAACGSPCEPVARMMTSRAGMRSASASSTIRELAGFR